MHSHRLKNLSIIALLSALVLIPHLAQAAVSVSLTLDRREANLPDSVRISVTLSGARSSDSDPVISGVEAFYVSPGGTSSRVQIINGAVSSTVDYVYHLQPKQTGTFQIGPARVTVDGNTYTSNIVTLRVVEQEQTSRQIRGSVFLTASLSSPKAYVEEQVVYTLKLCRRVRVSDLGLELPKVEGLVFKKLGEPSEYESLVDGSPYQVVEVRYTVIPGREGVFAIPPARMGMTVYEPRERSRGRSPNDPFSRDPFFEDPFFPFSRGKSMTIASEPLELTTVPLPVDGVPGDFSGLVGQFRIAGQLEPKQIKAGDSATLTVQLKGRGNVTRMPDLTIPEIFGTKIYADQPVVESGMDEDGMTGSKTMKWAIVPEREGQYEIPALSLSFFDPETAQYKVVKTTPALLSVTPGDTPQVGSSGDEPKRGGSDGPVKQEIKALGRDILPIHTSVKNLAIGSGAVPSASILWILLLVPPLLVGVLYGAQKIQSKAQADRTVIKAKKAAKAFIHTCRRPEMRFVDLIGAVQTYLNDRFHLSLGSLTPKEAYDLLTSRGVAVNTAEQLEGILKKIEIAVYTGKGEKPSLLGKDLAVIIKQVEKELR